MCCALHVVYGVVFELVSSVLWYVVCFLASDVLFGTVVMSDVVQCVVV